MIALWIFLWLLLGIFGLILLVLLLLCISLGVRLDTTKGSEMRVTLLFGPFFWRLKKKTPSEKSIAKKAARKEKKKQKAALRQEKQAAKAAKQMKKKASAPKKPKPKKKKPSAPSDTTGTIRALLATLGDYDYPYAKLVKISRLRLAVQVGGKDSGDVGRRYAAVSAAFGNAFPLVLRIFNLRRYDLRFSPDFAQKKTAVVYDVSLRIRPIVWVYAGLVFLKGFLRNSRIYMNKPVLKTVFASASHKKGGIFRGKQPKTQNQ